uniref:Ribosomal RNA-processing protein 8 n=1 Tax=Arcella intermedia TaxID=1963864 RepID=A0A6B2LH91_9EUKA
MEAKLSGAQFRWLNEKLYTSQSDTSFDFFQENPDMFQLYHDGFRTQVSKWPVNPLDVIISELKKLPDDRVIADFGCGEAVLAKSLPEKKVYSLDLVAKAENVIVCDMAKVPLADDSVDVAVFCLSLMGTNVVDFLMEARRVLKLNGTLKIAEVKSRFDDNLDQFISLLASLGFRLSTKDEQNTMFTLLNCQYVNKGPPLTPLPPFHFKSCKYKKR